jgi:hypothetical protein
MFPALRRDGRTIYLSERCRACEDIIAGGDGVINVALHVLWRDSWSTSRKKERTPEFTLRFDEVQQLWVAQGGLCAMTGRPMDCRAKLDRLRDPYAPSIDRIDSNGPYAMANVQLVCWIVNRMKSDMSVAELMDWCSAVVANSNTAVDNQAA